ncbi:peptidyl-prolyl cis/trans isomerase (trigger factor), molecular chaperone involved in cell division [Candidatus Competibacter denitrificans Run_A_D11]|uniref:Trigger factor n=1 Tax=Candidatus Competibacter denitrificans Run_A_D11 TaxID=1400863 RepID=W6MCD3_9GAMM|nr:trigger factor [Candidatus Competibacter denitrificans]CDI03980.1 peptidyl-prolyl cis/trans isomerase (trigger factor), molecular chaperone involved in cell division [Candidatus Competibacter denitrificans Run_A_D11]HRC70553.1 trigger factor [Candidatus Competibacter denitrificans]
MQVSVETLSDLERRVTVQVPAEKLTKEIQDRLLSLSKQVKVDGFRPGKVPFKMVKRLYGERVRYEAVTELMERSLHEALTLEKLNPLGGPRIEPKKIEEDQNLEYSATFEVMPEFEPTGFESIHVEKPVAEITDQDVDHMIQTLREQRTVWNKVDRPAAEGDRLYIDFEGKIDGESFAGGKAENATVILGKGTMLQDFENGLKGLRADEQTEFDVPFPEDYQAAELAGKTARFQVTIHDVEEPILPEVDEAFAESLDVKENGVAGLRQSLRENMERELRGGITAAIKRQVMQGLWDANPIPLPKVLIEAEIEHLARQLSFPAGGDDEKIRELKSKLFEREARRRVALGLLISRLAALNSIKADERRVRDYLATVASTYQEPAQVLRWYEKTPEALDNVRALVLEEQIVDWLLERGQVSEKTSTFAEVMALSKKQQFNPWLQESPE